MYFGYNDVVNGQPQLRDDNSCALDVHEIQYFESEDAFKNCDFSMLSLLVMIQRAQNNDFYNYKDKIDCYPKVLDGCYLPPLTVLWFVQKVFEIVCLEDNEWAYDYGYHNMKRDYALWKRLVASSNNVRFNHNNL